MLPAACDAGALMTIRWQSAGAHQIVVADYINRSTSAHNYPTPNHRTVGIMPSKPDSKPTISTLVATMSTPPISPAPVPVPLFTITPNFSPMSPASPASPTSGLRTLFPSLSPGSIPRTPSPAHPPSPGPSPHPRPSVPPTSPGYPSYPSTADCDKPSTPIPTAQQPGLSSDMPPLEHTTLIAGTILRLHLERIPPTSHSPTHTARAVDIANEILHGLFPTTYDPAAYEGAFARCTGVSVVVSCVGVFYEVERSLALAQSSNGGGVLGQRENGEGEGRGEKNEEVEVGGRIERDGSVARHGSFAKSGESAWWTDRNGDDAQEERGRRTSRSASHSRRHSAAKDAGEITVHDAADSARPLRASVSQVRPPNPQAWLTAGSRRLAELYVLPLPDQSKLSSGELQEQERRERLMVVVKELECGAQVARAVALSLLSVSFPVQAEARL